MIPETMAPAPEILPDSWEWLKMLVSPTLSTGTYFKTVLPKLAIEQIFCTRARCFAKKPVRYLHPRRNSLVGPTRS